jgi:hypothetical protein
VVCSLVSFHLTSEFGRHLFSEGLVALQKTPLYVPSFV